MERHEQRPAYRVLSTRTIGVAAAMLVAIGVGLAGWLLSVYGAGTESDRAQLDAIRTAGAIVVGTGGAAALWLAARRQRTTEIALQQKDIDQAQADRAHALQEKVAAETLAHQEKVAAETKAHQERVAAETERDAAERRVTELYTKAVEQLGSDKAPVRLGGMYALERLAQNVPDQRQTIVNVLCAYLRMPYAMPPTNAADDNEASIEPTGNPEAREEIREQERQVRLTAQRILAAHLHPGWFDAPIETFWHGIDLDLTGATLLDFDLSCCHIRNAGFSHAQFRGTTKFIDAWFNAFAEFDRAQFTGDANFERARFTSYTKFDRAKFHGTAKFSEAGFSGLAAFAQAQFGGHAWFDKTRFHAGIRFDAAHFDHMIADFDGARVRVTTPGLPRHVPAPYVITAPEPADGNLPDAEDAWGYIRRQGS
jgi:uncharacterized protein YjbI with pentapeptide repeats